ncbi:helix-turn-helix domain-containing protein [Bradyrhizobium sp.]|uniref:helix-turn-helix domain-containing protein n=1 Tax=Bradyrhizobium sp. TaxID=376 RepID=UPI0025B8A71D|nr:helix-turn-helix domain-containing protein [Bradyrhizobium sp.]
MGLLDQKLRSNLEPGTAAAAHRHLIDITHLILSGSNKEAAEVRERSIQAARLAAALAYIERHYFELDLMSSSVATALGKSIRYLERLLESSGRSYSVRVMKLRLAAAHRLLSDPASTELRIDTALSVGFSDLSHFNRRFRQRFGEAPRAARQHARLSTSLPPT